MPLVPCTGSTTDLGCTAVLCIPEGSTYHVPYMGMHFFAFHNV